MDFNFPDVAEGIREGKLVSWKVKEGDLVKQDQVLCEIETDKSVLEIPSPRAGIIQKLHVQPGETVLVGKPLVSFSDPNNMPSEKKILPKDRKLAELRGINLGQVQPSGPDGRVTSEDLLQQPKPTLIHTPTPQVAEMPVRRASPSVRKMERELEEGQLGANLGGAATSVSPAQVQNEERTSERISLPNLRSVIKKHMETAWRVPHASVTIEFNADKLYAHKEQAASQLAGIKLTYLPYVIRAVAAALENFPVFNSRLDEEKQELILKKQVNIGIAIDTDYGLVVPNIKDCHQKSITQLAKALQELVQKARQRKLAPSDNTDGSFTISNIGSFGAKYGAAIINYPETAILMTGRIYESLTLQNNQPVTQKIFPLTLTFDHRVIDGADAGRFLNYIIELLQDPQFKLDVI